MPLVGTRALVLLVDGHDFTDQVATVTVKSGKADSDFVTFADAAHGGARDYTLSLKMAQNTTAGALWDYVWDHSGETVDYEVWPLGIAVDASPTRPKFFGNVIISEPDGELLGGDANVSATARLRTEVDWECTAKPTKDIGES
jgi:hypothetical protein